MGRKRDGSPQARHGAGSAWQLPNGSWRCKRLLHGKAITGAGKTGAAARAEMNRKVRAEERGEPQPNQRAIPPSIGSVGPAWLASLRFTARAPGTLDNYVRLYRKWIGPLALEDFPRKRPKPPAVDISKQALATLGPDQRRAWWLAMSKAGASRSTIRNVDHVLTALLRANKRVGIHPDVLDTDAIERPTVDRAPRRRPSAAEMLRLIAHCTVDGQEGSPAREPYATLFALEAITAARGGEVRGLHWGDVDELRGGITIRLQMDRVTRAPRDTKGHAQRYVSLDGPDSDAMRLLAAHKRRQQERGLPTGAGDPVFLHRFFASKPPCVVSQSAISVAFHKARRAAGLPTDLTPHALRHGSAMLSLRTGTDLVTLQKKLGHAELSTTACYLEADTELAQQDAARVAAAFKVGPRRADTG